MGDTTSPRGRAETNWRFARTPQTSRNLLGPFREPHSETHRPLGEFIPKYAGAPHNYHLFVEMTPFRKPKPTAFREPQRPGTPEHPEDPSRRRVRARSGTPSPHPPDGGTSPGVTAAAPKNGEYEKMPESPAPASHESAVSILPFSAFRAQKKSYTFRTQPGRRSVVAGTLSTDPPFRVTGFAGFVCVAPGRLSSETPPEK